MLNNLSKLYEVKFYAKSRRTFNIKYMKVFNILHISIFMKNLSITFKFIFSYHKSKFYSYRINEKIKYTIKTILKNHNYRYF